MGPSGGAAWAGGVPVGRAGWAPTDEITSAGPLKKLQCTLSDTPNYRYRTAGKQLYGEKRCGGPNWERCANEMDTFAASIACASTVRRQKTPTAQGEPRIPCPSIPFKPQWGMLQSTIHREVPRTAQGELRGPFLARQFRPSPIARNLKFELCKSGFLHFRWGGVGGGIKRCL